MDRSNLTGERPSNIGPSRTKSTSGSHHSSTSPLGRDRGGPFDHSLLTPVVRSKRTPIACTECRRRQVKCTGGTPQCERCEKKGIKCEYIPIHQQRQAASGAAASAQPVQAAIHLSRYPSAQSSRSVPSSPISWQQSSQAYQDYSTAGSSIQQGDWQVAYSLPSQRYMQQTVQSAPAYIGMPQDYAYQTGAPYAGGAQASVETHQAYVQQGLVIPSHQEYSSSVSHDVYGHSNAETFGYGMAEQQLPSSYMASTSQHSAYYPAQYSQSQQAYYDTTDTSALPEELYGGWVDPTNPNYAGYQGDARP